MKYEYPAELPVSAARDEIASAVKRSQVVIVSGQTGSGKTTQLPKILLELGRGTHGKQIVLTSDTYPRNLKDFQERLLSRLTQGLIVTIEPPEFDMRVQILLLKAERSGLDMPREVAEIIAKKLKSNVRELEGAVQQVLAYTRFHQVDVTIDTVKLALRDIFKASSVPVTIDAIQQTVAQHYGFKVSELNSKSRKAKLVRARQIAIYLARELTKKSLPELGELFGGRDHATVIYACKKIAAERNRDEELKYDLHILEQKIKS